MSIYRMNHLFFKELRDYAIAYVQHVESGGCTCKFTSDLVEKTIDVVMKMKATRDWLCEVSNEPVPMYNEDGERIQ